jgi:hypothetical protein
MHRQRILLAAFTLSLVTITPRHEAAAQEAAVMAAREQSGKPAPSTFPVTSTIYDFDSLGNALLLQSDNRNVDLTFTGQPWGIYRSDSATDVSNQIGGTNASAWTLNLSRSNSRLVNLTLNRLSGSGPTGTYALPAVVISKCFDPSGATTGDQNWFNITAADPNCSLRVNFTIGGTNYALTMSPLYDSPQPTGRATVTCTQASGNSCFAWSVVPNLTPSSINPNPTVANLFSVGRNGAFTFVGQYALTYRAHVTYP